MRRIYRLAISLRQCLKAWAQRGTRDGSARNRPPIRFVPGFEALERRETTNVLYNPIGAAFALGALAVLENALPASAATSSAIVGPTSAVPPTADFPLPSNAVNYSIAIPTETTTPSNSAASVASAVSPATSGINGMLVNWVALTNDPLAANAVFPTRPPAAGNGAGAANTVSPMSGNAGGVSSGGASSLNATTSAPVLAGGSAVPAADPFAFAMSGSLPATTAAAPAPAATALAAPPAPAALIVAPAPSAPAPPPIFMPPPAPPPVAVATSTAVVSFTNPSTVGQPVTFIATVTAASGTGIPTGAVKFQEGPNTLGVSALAGSIAMFTTSSLSVGIHTITANYGGVIYYFYGSTGSTSQTVNAAPAPAATTTFVSSSPNPSTFGQPVTFTASVSAMPGGSGTPTGTVTFTDGGNTLGSGSLAAGMASFATSTLSVGAHTITATYGGDSNFTGSIGPTSQTVNAAPAPTATTTFVSSSPNPSLVGQSVTFFATVAAAPGSSGTPTGTVTFADGGNTLGSGSLAAGLASFSTSTLSVGIHTITATYGGPGNFAGSSGFVSQTVNVPATQATTTTVTSSPNPSTLGQWVTFTAHVAVVPGGSGTPAGNVTFVEGTTTLGTGSLAAGTASIATWSLSVGVHTITATYAGDSNFTGSNGYTSQTVNAINHPPVLFPLGAVTISAGSNFSIQAFATDDDLPAQALTFRLAGTPPTGLGIDPALGLITWPAASTGTPGSYTVDVVVTDNGTPAFSDSAYFTITVVASPVAVPDAYNVLHDTSLAIDNIDGLLSNDSVAAGATAAAVLVSPAQHGTLTLNSDGSFRYAPGLHYVGADSFSYYVTAAGRNSANATVSLTISDRAPDAPDYHFAVHGGTPLVVAAPGLASSASDPDGDPISFFQVSGPSHGALTLHADGTFTYQATPAFVGTDSFSYRTTDGALQSVAAGIVTIDVQNDAPVAQADAFDVAKNGSLPASAARNLLQNDFDLDGDPLTAFLVTAPTSAAFFTLNSDGTFNYAPQADFVGNDSFSYRVSDGTSMSSPVSVDIRVSDLPVAHDDIYFMPDYGSLLVSASDGVMRNDFKPT